MASDANGATVTLAGSERLTADLVVGADGVRSQVRQAIDPAAPTGRYVGLTNFGGITRGTLSRRPFVRAWHFVFAPRILQGTSDARRRRRLVRQRARARDRRERRPRRPGGVAATAIGPRGR